MGILPFICNLQIAGLLGQIPAEKPTVDLPANSQSSQLILQKKVLII